MKNLIPLKLLLSESFYPWSTVALDIVFGPKQKMYSNISKMYTCIKHSLV